MVICFLLLSWFSAVRAELAGILRSACADPFSCRFRFRAAAVRTKLPAVLRSTLAADPHHRLSAAAVRAEIAGVFRSAGAFPYSFCSFLLCLGCRLLLHLLLIRSGRRCKRGTEGIHAHLNTHKAVHGSVWVGCCFRIRYFRRRGCFRWRMCERGFRRHRLLRRRNRLLRGFRRPSGSCASTHGGQSVHPCGL